MWIFLLIVHSLAGEGNSNSQGSTCMKKLTKSSYVLSFDLAKVLLSITGVILSIFTASAIFKSSVTLNGLVSFVVLIVDLILGLLALSIMNGAIVSEEDFEVGVKSDAYQSFWWLVHFQFFYLLMGVAQMVGGLLA